MLVFFHTVWFKMQPGGAFPQPAAVGRPPGWVHAPVPQRAGFVTTDQRPAAAATAGTGPDEASEGDAQGGVSGDEGRDSAARQQQSSSAAEAQGQGKQGTTHASAAGLTRRPGASGQNAANTE